MRPNPQPTSRTVENEEGIFSNNQLGFLPVTQSICYVEIHLCTSFHAQTSIHWECTALCTTTIYF